MRVLTAEQEVPLHPLTGVAVRFDAARAQVGVEQEGQREREHLGLTGAVVAPQQQTPVAEVEFLHVVVEEIDEPGPQGLPAGAERLGECGGHTGPAFRCVGMRTVPDSRTTGSPTA